MIAPPAPPPVPEITLDLKGSLPALKMDLELLKRIGKIGEGAILENILRQKQASGAPLQRNKPSTQRLKAMKGSTWRGRVMSLIDKKKRFVKGQGRSFRSSVVDGGKAVYIEPSPFATGKPNVKQLAQWLQEPHPHRNRYLGWFGLNAKARVAIKKELRAWVKDELKKAARRLNPTGKLRG